MVNLAPVEGEPALPNGDRIEAPHELKRTLLNRKDQMARALTEKLLTYACGRPMTFQDHSEIDRITNDLSKRGNGFRDLIQLVVASKVFQARLRELLID